MVYHNFDELIETVKGFPQIKRVAVAAAEDTHSLEAIMKAYDERIACPVLVGDRRKILNILEEMGRIVPDEDIYDVSGAQEAAWKAVSLIREGKADFLMKGKLETADLLREVVKKETGLAAGNIMSHFVIQKVPTYHKLLVTTDGGMVLYPTLEQKKAILENAVNTLRAIGYECPKVAVLAAVERVNPKMPETLDAEALVEMNKTGIIRNCIVEGPLSFDIAFSHEIAEIKGYKGALAGDADIMLVPDIAVGNILGKSLVTAAKAKMAGFIVGAKVPIVLTSRGSSSEEKIFVTGYFSRIRRTGLEL